MCYSIAGKNIVIVGGARGIGGISAKRFAEQGANVATFDMRDDEGMALAEEATKAGPGRVVYRHLDVIDFGEIKPCIDWAAEELGGIDAVLDVAGGSLPSKAEETSMADWDWHLGANMKATGLVCQAAFPHMKERGGTITLIAAGGALKDRPILLSSYSASKGAVISYSRSVAAEWAPYNIRVNCVNPVMHSPGELRTLAAMSEEDQAKFQHQIHESIPLGRMGDIETELAPVLQFLMSDAAKYITSQIIAVDGGLCPLR
jgi:NAD(P)-dependent dehydrogenase (short-subunit alcohol dehydrogenase family)